MGNRTHHKNYKRSECWRRALCVLLAVVMLAASAMPVPFLENESTVYAAGTLNVSNLWQQKRDSLGWCGADNKPTDSMWQDTSALDAVWIDAGSVAVYETAANAVGQRIDHVETVVKDKVSDHPYSGATYKGEGDEQYETVIRPEWEGWDNSSVAEQLGLTVTESGSKPETRGGVSYDYKQVNISYKPADFVPNNEQPGEFYYTVEYDHALGGAYRNYYVSTADQLAWLLYYYGTDFSRLKATADEAKLQNAITSVNKLGIELLCDIDLGGKNMAWRGYRNTSVALELNGAGHHIYNGYLSCAKGAAIKKYTSVNGDPDNTTAPWLGRTVEISAEYGFFLGDQNGDQQFAIHDVTFSNMYIPHAQGMFGPSVRWAYFDNVNFTHCLSVGGGSSSAIVLGYSYLNSYFKDCTIDNSYVYGSGHSALFASYNGADHFNDITYVGDGEPDASRKYYYTDIPQASAALNSIEAVEQTWSGSTVNSNGYTLTNHYPSIYENCAAVDSEVYDGGEHSGTFVSCMQSGIIFKRCFSNSAIYANARLGVFIGAVIGSGDGFYYPYNDEKNLVNAYFEECYTAGSIEGINELGGFIGTVFNDPRAYNSLSNTATASRGRAIFKNCYSTSSVGMQYAGNYVGGFVGMVKGNIRAEVQSERQHIFENCYAAGETGGITTDTDVSEKNKTKIGGFIGAYVNYKDEVCGVEAAPEDSELCALADSNNTLTLINCCYDKQTTAMRERDAGWFNDAAGTLTGTLSGLTGVYTKSSRMKRISGLTDTVDMNNNKGTAWINDSDQYYPQLRAFMEKPVRSDYPEGDAGQMRYERQLQYYCCALVSTATVFLDHYERMLDENGEEITARQDIYDTVRDITQKFVFTTDDASGITWTNDNSAGSKNAQDGFVNKMGKTSADSTDTTGFSLDYDADGDDTTDFSYHFDPSVLVILEDDGVYKCLDFAPGKQWVKVTAAADDGAVTGTRRLRLLPTAYLNAGNIIHINVLKEEPDGTGTISELRNHVTITDDENNEIALPGLFNHSVGVSYAITDRYRMGTDVTYTGQKLTAYTGGSQTDTDSFAFYAGYSVTDAENARLLGKNTDADGERALNGMLDQRILIGANGGITNLSCSGKTMVKVYKAHPVESGGSIQLEKQEEIDYSADDNLAKWQGEAPFTLDDTGFYYLDYYWRLDDGRYLTDSKLVRISADSYSVELVTGILNEEHTVSAGQPKTAIDQYVTDDVTRSGSGGEEGQYVWDQAFPAEDSAFDADTAAGYYDSYNAAADYNGDIYYTKTMKLTTLKQVTAVGWYKTNDYALTTLIIEAIDQYGNVHEMARVDAGAGENQFDFNNAKYTYDFTTYTVTQDKETKLFTIRENTSVPIEFKIEEASDSTVNSITKYILFDFSTVNDNQAGYTQVNDNLRVTALFRKNTADIEAEKTVLLNADTDLEPVDTQTTQDVTVSYYEALSSYSGQFEVDNAVLSEEEGADDKNRKAVLGGDTLTYRVKLHNAGYFESDAVNVYDTVPDGCTYVEDSMKIYRQGVQLTDGAAKYLALEEIDADHTEGFGTSENNGALHWTLPGIALDSEYYVEYQVTVDEIGAEETKRLLTNTAAWNFICVNGNVTGDYTAGDLETLKNDAIFDMDVAVEEGGASSEKRTYTIEFSQKDTENTYQDIEFTNTFPEQGFTLDESENIRLEKYNAASGEWEEQPTGGTGQPVITIGRDGNNRAVNFTLQGLNVSVGERYRVSFGGEQALLGSMISDTERVEEISNKASVTYVKQSADGTPSDRQGNSIARTERISNEVITDVTHLYLNIEKVIDTENPDPSQSFLMQIAYYKDEENYESGQEAELFYTRINCTEPVTDNEGNTVGYSGSRIVQCGKRGIYVVTELADWSAADYDFDRSEAVHMSLTDSTGAIVYPSGVRLDRQQSSGEGSTVTIRMPELVYEASGAFPTSLGTDLTDLPTVVFYNNESAYAYLSGQAYAENQMGN